MRPWCGLILPLITAALYGLIWRFDPWLENTIVGHLLIRYEMCYFTQCDNACWNIQNVHDRWITKLWITWFIRYMYFWGCDLRSLCCGSEYKWPHCITIVYFFFLVQRTQLIGLVCSEAMQPSYSGAGVQSLHKDLHGRAWRLTPRGTHAAPSLIRPSNLYIHYLFN